MTEHDSEELCLDHLLCGRLTEACAFVEEIRGTANATSVEQIDRIFAATPTILRGVSTSDLQVLRIGAAMMELWGTNRCRQWMPRTVFDGLAARLRINVDSSALMVLFSAKFHRAQPIYPPGIVKQVEWLAVPDSCPACVTMNGRRFDVLAPPELPNENCTHHMGCRCVWLPVVEFET